MSSPNPNIDKAVEAAGGFNQLAKLFEVSAPAVHKFRRQGWLPLDRAKQVNDWFGIPIADLVKPAIADVMRNA